VAVHIYTQTVHRTTEITTEQHKLQLIVIWYDIYFINCNWVVTQWQYTYTHKPYIEQHKSQPNNTTNVEECGPCPSLRVLPCRLPYNWGKSTEKPQSVSVEFTFDTYIGRPRSNLGCKTYYPARGLLWFPSASPEKCRDYS